ncbi:MAG: PH domain-containing protein [Actinomycetes bacterium]
MGIPQRALGEDEEVVLSLRPHWKEVLPAALVLLLTAPVASYAAAAIPDSRAQTFLRLVVLVVEVVVLLRWSVWPFLRWVTTTYALTTERLITREGVFSRRGRDMPLRRVNDVAFSHSLLERMLGCGTLIVESGGERGQLLLRDVPHVEHVQREVYRWADAQSDDDDDADVTQRLR